MPYREYDPSPAGRVLRALTATFPVGTFFGVHVRMYWAAAVLMPLVFLRWAPGTGLLSIVLAAIFCVLLFVVVWTHEMGHIVAGWRHGIRTDLITLSPLGGVAHMNAPARTPREELWITLAGPAVHVVWLAVFWPLQWLLPARVYVADGFWLTTATFTVWFLVTTNATLLVFNLLPIFPLDGGRVLRALLSMRWHANRATMWVTALGIGGGVVLAVLGLWRQDVGGTIGVVLGLSCVGASLQERHLARHVLIYQQHRRDPWADDGDAWRRGAPGAAAGRPGWFTRWRRARAERRERSRAAEAAALDAEVDTILDRVHRVGMSGLSEREKAVLRRASRRRRGTG